MSNLSALYNTFRTSRETDPARPTSEEIFVSERKYWWSRYWGETAAAPAFLIRRSMPQVQQLQLQPTSVITHWQSNVNIRARGCPPHPTCHGEHRQSHVKLCSGCYDSSQLIGLKISSVALLPLKREKLTLMICVQLNRRNQNLV